MDRHSEKNLCGKRDCIILGIILALAALIRLPFIGTDGLWEDETFGATLAALPLSELIEHLRSDVHPPMYFFVLKLVHLAVNAEYWTAGVIRSVSLSFGLLGIWITYLLAGKLINANVGLTAAYLMAINPIHVHYSREARAYTLLILLITATIWSVTYLREHPSKRHAILCGVLMALLAYTHNMASLVLVPIILWLLLPVCHFQQSSYRNAFVISGLTALVLYLAWVPILFQQITLVSNIHGSRMEGGVEWVKPIWDFMFPTQVLRSIAALSHGSPPPIRNLTPSVPPEALLTAVLSLVLIFLGMLTKVRWRNRNIQNLMGYLLFSPLVLLFFISWVGTPIYIPGRVDTIVLPAYILLLAAGIHAVKGGRYKTEIDMSRLLPHVRQGRGFAVSEKFRSLLFVLLLAIFTTFSIIPNLREIQSAEGKVLQTWANKIIRRSDNQDVLIVTGPWRYMIEYYLMQANRQLHLLGYPESRNQHPTWIRSNDYDTAKFAKDARELARQAKGIAIENKGAVLVLNKEFLGSVEFFRAFQHDFTIVALPHEGDTPFVWEFRPKKQMQAIEN